MAIYTVVLPLLVLGSSITAQDRGGKSLVGTFPFNARNRDNSNHGDHSARARTNSLGDRVSKQGSGRDNVRFQDVSGASPGRDGKRCIDKVEMIEETEYDEEIQCDHSYDKRCHQTYVTQYESQQEEECDENFRKNCFIEYEKIAFNETATICRTPLVKDCMM